MLTAVTLLALTAIAAAGETYFSMQVQFVATDNLQNGDVKLRGKGASQIDTVEITANDAIKYRVANKIGSYMTIEYDALRASGNMTFGTHMHRDHAIFFNAALQILPPTGDLTPFTATGQITSGTGQFTNLSGFVGAVGTFKGYGTTKQTGTMQVSVAGVE